MVIWGITAYSHDASVAVIKDNVLCYASSSERYSRTKNDYNLNYTMLSDALVFGVPDKIIYYENYKQKRLRYFISKQYSLIFENPIRNIRKFLKTLWLEDIPIHYVEHHQSHAGIAYLSPFISSAILIIDSIGEFDTISIWKYEHPHIKKLWSMEYPSSLGLFYSAFAKALGLNPNEEEYIMMGMSAYGKPIYAEEIRDYFFTNTYELKYNLHRGIGNYLDKFNSNFNIASSVQEVLKSAVIYFAKKAFDLTNEKNLIYGGGVALNCCINTKLYEIFDKIWIFPNPGDSGSSVGAIGYFLKQKIQFDTPFLGYNIDREYKHDIILNTLLSKSIIGIANGRAEFGPRALGNRSILANPLISNISNIVNKIKRRELFRPFSPVILEEFFKDYFETNNVSNSKYMQFVFKCKNPLKYQGIVNIDGTSRVQTINKNENPNLYRLLLSFYERTRCPMLLNTSLNVKGQPIINTEQDAELFSNIYGIEVF